MPMQAIVGIVVGHAAVYDVAALHDGAAMGADPGVFFFYCFALAVRATGVVVGADEVGATIRAMADVVEPTYGPYIF